MDLDPRALTAEMIVVVGGKEVGIFGIVHPDVLSKFDIVNPCSVLELDLEPLLGGVDGRLEL